jgi:hypothetical protein
LAKEYYDEFPKELLEDNLTQLKATNKSIETTIHRYRENAPKKEEAYQYAYNLENSSYELRFQRIVDSKSESEDFKRLKKLNNDDKDHAERIKKLLQQRKTR